MNILCIVGDLNYNLLLPEKSHTLNNIIDTYSLKNLVKDPTCHTKNSQASLIDVIITNINSPSLLCNVINFDCGLSDCHNMIAVCFKENCISNKRHKVTFRSYKSFDEASFTQDLHRVPFQVATVFDDADDCYWAYETLLMDIVDEHAPKKQKYPKKDSPPFMNAELRDRSLFIPRGGVEEISPFCIFFWGPPPLYWYFFSKPPSCLYVFLKPPPP